ncbi:OmpA family protein [Marinimicrobium sp. ABcell2]|uniref:OmpA family protein n=1 Tax=Marinimicrobium sp. ABcell2 TaxID=3069751 RepID=UPI0027B1CE33|nr:OmpA family protein [Marinimicrobium sp. ABcell2]MDQ2075904.1 OmpA family protein [Marinimicrobium sp. ABcell2]
MKIITTYTKCPTAVARKALVMPTAVSLLALALAASFPAQANTEAGQFSVSPFVGLHKFESKQNLEDSFTYGIRLGYSFTEHWALEGAVSFVGSDVDDATLTDPAKGQFSSPADSVDLMLYQLDALYHFRPRSKLSPYVVFGYGAADYSPSISDKNMSTFNLGVGAKYWIAENLALRFDLRDHFVSEVFSDGFHNVSATMGVTFTFGGSTSKTRNEPVVRPSPAPRPAVVEEKVIALTFDDIHFDFDQSTLTSEAKALLQTSVKTLKENPKTKVRIAGYTSASGTAEHNQALSERRATAIENYLIDQGISNRRLSTIGYGNTRPVSYETDPSNQNSVAAKENMRALFEIVVE